MDIAHLYILIWESYMRYYMYVCLVVPERQTVLSEAGARSTYFWRDRTVMCVI